MTCNKINPYVRFARRRETLFRLADFVAKDNRLFYVERGFATAVLCGEEYKLSQGDIVFWRAGVKYRIILGENAVLSGFNFDFTQKNAHIKTPIPPEKFTGESDGAIEDLNFSDTDIFSSHFIIRGAFSLRDKIYDIIDEFENRHNYYEERCSAVLKDILTTCLRLSKIDEGDKSTTAVNALIGYIKEHYSSKIDNTTLGNLFNYHPNYISSVMKKHTGKTLHKYVLDYRMYEAVNMLQTTTLSVGEIAERVGMGDIYHFSKLFKKIIGRNPNSFRK